MRRLALPFVLPLALLLVLSSGGQARSAASPPHSPGVDLVAQGLVHPWAVAFLPDGAFLVTERPGRLRRVAPDGKVGAPLGGVPEVAAAGQGGLLDLVLDARFSRNRRLYLCYSEPGAQGTSSTALARAELSADASRLEGLTVLLRQHPKVDSGLHFGCRIVQQGAHLYLTLGERFHRAEDAQSLDNHHGKVVRIGTDGGVPADNPFVGRSGALPEIWSYGHRNPQGATLGPDGRLWVHEHGPQGGDEINRPGPGDNHGWPRVSLGRHYNGAPVGTGAATLEGTVPPVHHWTPSIAPSGMAFVSGGRYGPDWEGSLLVGSLKFRRLVRLELDPGTGRVRREHHLLADLGQRVRDVRLGPDGLVYLLTDDANGRLLRLRPR